MSEVIYLTNACGEDTGHGTINLTEADYAKVVFEDGPGVVLPYIVQIGKKKFIMGNLEVAFKDDFWGDDRELFEPEDEVRSYCEAIREYASLNLTKGMKLLPLDEDMPGRFVVSVAVPLDRLQDNESTKVALQTAFGKFTDLP